MVLESKKQSAGALWRRPAKCSCEEPRVLGTNPSSAAYEFK